MCTSKRRNTMINDIYLYTELWICASLNYLVKAKTSHIAHYLYFIFHILTESRDGIKNTFLLYLISLIRAINAHATYFWYTTIFLMGANLKKCHIHLESFETKESYWKIPINNYCHRLAASLKWLLKLENGGFRTLMNFKAVANK